MTLNLEQLALLGLITAAAHWIIGRSEIARPFWSRVTGWPGKLLACPACSGFWLGLGLAGLGVRPVAHGSRAVEVLAAGVLATIVAPVFQAVMLWGLRSSAIPIEPTGAEPEAPAPAPAPDVEDKTPPPTSPMQP